jgi:serine phosphatase RsbU (regulator of sigma subunit)
VNGYEAGRHRGRAPASAGMLGQALSRLLEASHRATFERLPGLIAAAAREVGAGGARLFLADLQQEVLREVTGVGPDAGRGGEHARIEGTLPGRAYQTLQMAASPSGGSCWVPLLDGTERLGVLRVDPPPEAGGLPDPDVLRALASMAGLLLLSKRSNSDSHARLVRTRRMGVSAELQWTLMPPRTFANDRVTVSTVMEPAYRMAGDAFDYAITGDTAHLAIFDAMGHDTSAGLTASLSMATCRSHRRAGSDLAAVSQAIEQELMEQFGHSRYATGILAGLNLVTGQLRWVNRGHLLPVVIRGGRWATTLHGAPAGPMGAGLGLPVQMHVDQLEPGDRLLLFTDGITEARDSHGELFGQERFTDFLIRHHADGLPVAETLRRLIHAVLQHHDGRLYDDATVLFCEWHGKEADR